MEAKKQNDIIRTTIGFLAAILLHLLIVLLFLLSRDTIIKPPAPKGSQKIEMDLRYFQPPPAPKPKPKPKPVVLPTPEPKPQKVTQALPKPKEVIDKNSILTTKNDNNENNETNNTKPTKVVKKRKPIKKKKIVKKKKEIKKIVKKEKLKKKITKRKITKQKPTTRQAQRAVKKQKSALGNALMSSGRSRSIQTSPYSRKKVNAATKKIINQLYGSEFDSFGSAQKRFIENNLALIHRITQGTLSRNGYPEIAARTGQQGVNIVSFDLHPNGNISNLRLEHRMGYEALDQNTLQVIRIAYKDYPLPQKTTKIKFYVEYTIDPY